MPRKKKEEETNDVTTAEETEATDAAAGASDSDANENTVEALANESDAAPKKRAAKKAKGDDENVAADNAASDDSPSILDSVIDTVTSAKTKTNRAEKVGIVASDKMTKTVTVRVDRQVKHPVYRKYIKRRKKFMAHDELGAGIGDKVRIIETRPLSARKRWRVVEIIQKAEK